MGEWLLKPNIVYNGNLEEWGDDEIPTGWKPFTDTNYNVHKDYTTRIEGLYSAQLNGRELNWDGLYGGSSIITAVGSRFSLYNTKSYRFHVRYKVEWVSANHGVHLSVIATEGGWNRTLAEDGTWKSSNEIIKSPATTDWYELTIDIDAPIGEDGDPLDNGSVRLFLGTWYSEFATLTQKKFIAWVDDVWIYEKKTSDDIPDDATGWERSFTDTLGIQESSVTNLGKEYIWLTDKIYLTDRLFSFSSDAPPPEYVGDKDFDPGYSGDDSNAIVCYWTSKTFDMSEINKEFSGRFKIVDRAVLEYIDKDAETPYTVEISVDGGRTWASDTRTLGTGNGKVKSAEFHFADREQICGKSFIVRVGHVSATKKFVVCGLSMRVEIAGEWFGSA